MNIDCKPTSLFSWDFFLTRGPDQVSLQSNWMTEQGAISIGNHHYEISKQGFLSGEWQLLDGEAPICIAHKPNALTRRFELTFNRQEYELAPTGLGRSMMLEGPGLSLHMSPNNPFTRSATIKGQGDELLLASFGFWLTTLVWKRAARSSNS